MLVNYFSFSNFKLELTERCWLPMRKQSINNFVVTLLVFSIPLSIFKKKQKKLILNETVFRDSDQ